MYFNHERKHQEKFTFVIAWTFQTVSENYYLTLCRIILKIAPAQQKDASVWDRTLHLTIPTMAVHSTTCHLQFWCYSPRLVLNAQWSLWKQVISFPMQESASDMKLSCHPVEFCWFQNTHSWGPMWNSSQVPIAHYSNVGIIMCQAKVHTWAY